MKVVRDSKYRHVHAEVSKVKFDDVRPSNKGTESSGLRANAKFLALSWESGGGGAIACLDITKPGRTPSGQPLITGHRGPILDFEFNPFNDNMILSCSEDLTVKLWDIPDGGLKEHLKEPLANFEGHGKKISFCTFNPSAENIFATNAFDMKTKIWNIDEQAEAFNIDMPEQAWSLKWNHTGSLLAACTKDKKMNIIDPRASKIVASSQVHEGAKPLKIAWLGSNTDTDQNYKILTTGFTKQAEREIGLWDMRKFGGDAPEPLNLLCLDQGTGALYPHYDAGTGMAFFPGKGDGNVRYFEMTDEDPYIHFISQYGSTQAQKSFEFLPKRCCDTTTHEIMKGLKMENTSILQVSFKVPRKSEAFQEDIFPDCPGVDAAMTSESWAKGDECKAPKLQSMKPGAAGPGSPKKAAVAIVSVASLKKDLAAAMARIAELEKENAALKAK